MLTRQLNGSTPHDTYYVYDSRDDLCFVLQPEYQTEADLEKYAFQYKYDGYGRCSEKTIPGAGTVRYDYDASDRVIFSQDGNLNAKNHWTYYEYDDLDRLTEQGECNGKDKNTKTVWLKNYYDNYDFRSQAGFNSSNFPAGTANAKGYLTGSEVTVPGTTTKLYTAYYYDVKGRVTKTVQSNLQGGYDVTTTTYTFTDQPQTVTHTHTANGQTTLTEVYTYTYDYEDRLTQVQHKLGSTQVTLATYTYDDYGRLASKKLHGSATNQLTYTYNIRDWVTGITGTKFSQNLYYNTGNGTACYNGNISSMTWKAGNESTTRGYKFAYDGLNRLTTATYGEGTAISGNTNRFTEKVTGYDKNGNIKALQRYGQTSASGYGLIDNLTYTLDGNRPTRVDDAVSTVAYNNGFEFKDGVKQANEYAYDANGNLTKDLNKGILNIEYNFLNLPDKVVFSDGSTIEYVYAADGTKLRTKHVINGTTTTTDYCGNVIYENGVRKYLLTEEGYVTLADNKYHYYLQDHQGNNRVVVDQSGTVEETNHYYPFGGLFASASSVQPYKYNGKELDTKKGLNWYDYGARMYDAALGRFTTQDAFAEKYPGMSPYQYGANNPVCNIDVNGDSIWFTSQYQNSQLEKLTMHVTGKVLNDSPNNIDMDFAVNSISKAINRAYQGNIDGVAFETDVQLSVAENMNDVVDSDHLFVLTDKIIQPKGKTIYGLSNYMGGKVAFIDAGYFTGPYDRMLGSRNYGAFTAAHEFGHLLNLNHSDRNPFNVMRSNGMFYGVSSSQLGHVYSSWNAGILNYGSNFFVTPFGVKRPNIGIMQRFIRPY